MLAGFRAVIINWLTHRRPPPGVPLSDFERLSEEIKVCDVILVEGRSRVSDVIRWVTQSSWTHAALYIGSLSDLDDPALRDAVRTQFDGDPSQQLIIESELGLGTIVRGLDTYACDHLRVCRPRGLSEAGRRDVIRYAIGRLGTRYNVRQIFDLMRFLFPWFAMPRRWRSTLFQTNAGDATHTVCSTMIAEGFGSVDYPILPLVKRIENGRLVLYRRNPKLCTPADFDYSPYFDIVKYPFLDMYRYADRYLSRREDAGSLNSEEAGIYLPHPLADSMLDRKERNASLPDHPDGSSNISAARGM